VLRKLNFPSPKEQQTDATIRLVFLIFSQHPTLLRRLAAKAEEKAGCEKTRVRSTMDARKKSTLGASLRKLLETPSTHQHF